MIPVRVECVWVLMVFIAIREPGALRISWSPGQRIVGDGVLLNRLITGRSRLSFVSRHRF